MVYSSWSLGDVISGMTVAATSVPQYVAYAEMSDLSGHHGLKSSGPPIIAFAFLTTSPTLCIGVTSITALMAHRTLRGGEYKVIHGEERWMDLLGTFSVLVGICSLLLAVSGAAKLARLVPPSVKSGWKLGFAVTVVVAQAPGAFFGAGSVALRRLCASPSVPSPVGGPPWRISDGALAVYRFCWTLVHPLSWDPAAATLAGLTLVVVLRGRRPIVRLLRLPGAEVLVACAVGTLLSLITGYAGDVVGALPKAPPVVVDPDNTWGLTAGWVRRWPWDMPWAELVEHLGGLPSAVVLGFIFAIVDFLAIVSVVPDSPSNELVGQGVACLVSGMVGSAPVGGSLSRSMVAGLAGASSPLAGLISGFATLALALPHAAVLLAPMPKAVLAAVVLAAVLPSVVRPIDLLKLRGMDACVGWLTAVVSCLVDPQKGFGVGLAAYVVMRLSSHRGGGTKVA